MIPRFIPIGFSLHPMVLDCVVHLGCGSAGHSGDMSNAVAITRGNGIIKRP